jgi:hypothetical protein
MGMPDRCGEGGGDDEGHLEQEVAEQHAEELGHLVRVRVRVRVRSSGR